MNKKSDINREKKREMIILSAKNLIIQKGYRKTNVEDITNGINIAKGSFYTYFKSKDQLIIKILQEAVEAICEKNSEARELELGFEELLKCSIEKKFNVDKEVAFRTLFLYHLSLNLDMLSRDITEKLIEIKNLNINHWFKIIKLFQEELHLKNDREIERYAEYIDELLTLTLKNTLYYGKNENGNIFIDDIDCVLKKTNKKSIDEEKEFLIKTIKKFFKQD
ncbi:MAG: TetR/AcrR family transcriptional regulator [Fusobacteriaceae bacterium]